MPIISCVIVRSRSGQRGRPLKAQIGLSLTSATGKGYIGGTVSATGGEKPDFRVHAFSDVGLPNELCQELLLAAYAACPAHAKNGGSLKFISNFRRWLKEWFRPQAAIRIAQTLEEAIARCGWAYTRGC